MLVYDANIPDSVFLETLAATDVTRASSQVTEGTRDLEGSFLTSLAFGLFVFTIFYNILFITVIKPAIDGPEKVAEIDLYASNSWSNTDTAVVMYWDVK